MRSTARIQFFAQLTSSLAFIAFCFGCAMRQESIPSATGIARWHQVPLGLCEDYPEESRSLAAARRDLQVLATNNIRVLRIAFGWDAMEPEPGKYDWSFWDDFVRIATDEYHIRLIPYICYTPRWASSSQGEDFWQQPPKDNAAFAGFVKQLVARYQDRIHSWEIWNEPDNPAYWRGTVEQFEDLLAAGGHAVREADPNAKVVMGGLAWNLNFLEAVITNPSAVQNVDVINLHNYYETWSSDPLENISDYVGHAHDLLRQHGQQQPIWLAEVGFSSYRTNRFVSGQYQAVFCHEHTPEDQAAVLFRVLTLLHASGKVSLVAWYRINDLPHTQEVIGDVNNRHLGVLDEVGKPKPALRALNYFNSLFAAGFRCLDQEVRVTKIIGSPVEVHAFEKADGGLVVIAWLKNYVPGTRFGNINGLVQDARRTKISLALPLTATRARCGDELGNRVKTIPTHSRNSSTHIDDLKLQGGQVAVVILQ